MLTEQIKREIIAHSQYQNEIEICGLICEGGEVVPCVNSAQNPREEFEILTDVFLGINANNRVKAVYHSHWQDSDQSWLSAADVANSKALKLPYILYHSNFGEWDLYDPNNLYPYCATVHKE